MNAARDTRSARALHEPVDERAQAVAHLGSSSVAPASASDAFVACVRATVIDASMTSGVAISSTARVTCGHSSLRPSSAAQLLRAGDRVDHGQRVDAFVHVVPGGLAELGLGAR